VLVAASGVAVAYRSVGDVDIVFDVVVDVTVITTCVVTLIAIVALATYH